MSSTFFFSFPFQVSSVVTSAVSDDDVYIDKVTCQDGSVLRGATAAAPIRPTVSRDMDFRTNQPISGNFRQTTLFTNASQLPPHVLQQLYSSKYTPHRIETRFSNRGPDPEKGRGSKRRRILGRRSEESRRSKASRQQTRQRRLDACQNFIHAPL